MADAQRAGALVRLVPMAHVTVEADVTVDDARIAAERAGGSLVVVLRDGILDAVVDVRDLRAPTASASVVDVADGDPPATRPNATAVELLERVRGEGLAWVAVTDTGGRFLGIVDGDALADLARRDELP